MLASLQRQLEWIYEIEIPHSVDDYLITDRAALNNLQGHDESDASEIEEQLLVVQDGDSVDIALYVDDEIVNRLAHDDPRSRLHAGNLVDYCTVMEGVSHFLYLIWNAGYERGVSLMELEMQAEIDKYVSTAFLFGRQGSDGFLRVFTGGFSKSRYSILRSTEKAWSATATRTTTRASTAPGCRNATSAVTVGQACSTTCAGSTA